MQTSEQYLRQQVNARTLMDIGLGDVRKPPPLFEDLLLKKSIIMVSAEPFTGKTMFCLAAMLALDAGKPLMNTYAPHQHQRTLFVGQDSPLWDYAEQCRKLMLGYELTDEIRSSLSSDLVINAGLDLGSKGTLDLLTAWHEEVGFDVLMLDTLASVHTMDENSNTEMNFIMSRLKMLRQLFNCTILFTHHDSKPSKDAERSAVYRPRGASIISGSVDIHISLREGKNGTVNLTLPKGRGLGRRRKPIIYEMTDCGTPEAPGIRFTLVSAAPGVQGKVLQYVKSCTDVGGVALRKDIIAHIKSEDSDPSTAADTALAALEREQQIKKVGRGAYKVHSADEGSKAGLGP